MLPPSPLTGTSGPDSWARAGARAGTRPPPRRPPPRRPRPRTTTAASAACAPRAGEARRPEPTGGGGAGAAAFRSPASLAGSPRAGADSAHASSTAARARRLELLNQASQLAVADPGGRLVGRRLDGGRGRDVRRSLLGRRLVMRQLPYP